MSINSDQVFSNALALSGVNIAINLGLSNTLIAAADTVAGLKSAITGLSSGLNADSAQALQRCADGVQQAANIGTLTDANILSLTTATGLRALFTAQDGALVSTDTIGLPGQ